MPESRSLPSFNVGDVVVNLSVLARVVAPIDPERGLLLVEVDRPRSGKWFADPRLCRPVSLAHRAEVAR